MPNVFPFSTSVTLPPSYGQGLYENLQQLLNQQKQGGEEQINAGYMGPENIGGSLKAAGNLQKGYADQSLQGGAGVLGQLAGVDVGQRRLQDKRNFRAEQAGLNRNLNAQLASERLRAGEDLATQQGLGDKQMNLLQQLKTLLGFSLGAI